MKGLILTGCAGFIGINFLKNTFIDKTQLTRYSIIISIDKLGYATKYNKELYKGICKSLNIITIDANINDISAMNKFYDPNSHTEIDIKWDILDFASESHVDNSVKDPAYSFTENSSIPANLIKWIGGVNKINKYLHISTDEVYGDIEYEKINNKENWFNSHSTIKPSNPYSASKVAQDMYLHSLWKTFGLKVTLIRMANQFGPYQHPEKMIPASIIRALNGENIKVYGSGSNIRQWTWVEDTVNIIAGILFSPMISENFDVIHISDERNILTNNTISKLLVEELKSNNIMTNIEYIEDRKGHDTAYALVSNYNNFKSNINERVKEVVKWYISNKGLYNVK